MAGKAESGPGVIESAFELLEILRALGRARLTELTAESALPRTTVYRLLGQLAAVGAVERIGAHYRLGPGLLALGQHVTPMERLRAIAQRPLIELAAATPAHVGLATTTSRLPMYLEVLNGRDRLPIRRVPGEPVPAGSAGTRVLTSGLTVAIDDSDSIDGVSCAAVAIPLPGGDAAAVGVVVPMSRLPRPMLAPLQTTANRIAALLTLHTGPGAAATDHVRRIATQGALDELAGWADEGQLKAVTKIWDGLDTAPAALVAMLAGENLGQVVVRVGPNPTALPAS